MLSYGKESQTFRFFIKVWLPDEQFNSFTLRLNDTFVLIALKWNLKVRLSVRLGMLILNKI